MRRGREWRGRRLPLAATKRSLKRARGDTTGFCTNLSGQMPPVTRIIA
jgi:hypothetical protein